MFQFQHRYRHLLRIPSRRHLCKGHKNNGFHATSLPADRSGCGSSAIFLERHPCKAGLRNGSPASVGNGRNYQQKEIPCHYNNPNSGLAFRNRNHSGKAPHFKGEILIEGKRIELAMWENVGRDGETYYGISSGCCCG